MGTARPERLAHLPVAAAGSTETGGAGENQLGPLPQLDDLFAGEAPQSHRRQ